MPDFLRPDGDDTIGNWTDEGASTVTLYDGLDETVSSTTDYIQSGENPIADVYRATLSDTTSGVDTTAAVTIDYVYGKDDNGKIDLDVDLVEGASTIASASHTDVVDGATGEIILDGTQKGNVTSWDALKLQFTANDGYAVDSNGPELVADFVNHYYRKSGTDTDFDGLFTYTGATQKTMVDSDGNLKWAPHNLAINSATPATQTITVVSGAEYTVEMTGTGSFALTGAGTGTASSGSPATITASTTSLTITLTGSADTVWVYRSDLGGMVNNPDRGDSYVPTTGSAVYSPRIGHHVYNGTSWVNKGVYLEEGGKTNLCDDSNNDTAWATFRSSFNSDAVTSPDGNTNAIELIEDSSASTTHGMYDPFTVTDGTDVTFSVYLKANTRTFAQLHTFGTIYNNTGNADLADINLSTGAITPTANCLLAGIEDVGNGWYRCWASYNSPASGRVAVLLADSLGGASYTGDGSSSIYMYGIQVEEALQPSTFIPTAGATVSRGAETLDITAGNASAGSAVSMCWKGGVWNNTTSSNVDLMTWPSGGSAVDELSIQYDRVTTTTGQMEFYHEYNNTGINSVTSSTTYFDLTDSEIQPINAALASDTTSLRGAEGGTSFTANTGANNVPQNLSTSAIGFGSGPEAFMGYVEEAKVFESVGLSDAQLQTATS